MRLPAPLNDVVGLVRPNRRRVWSVMLGITAVAGLLEAVGALVVAFVMRVATTPDADLVVPVLGDLRERFPDADDRTIIIGIVAFAAAFFVVRTLVSIVQSYVAARVVHSEGVLLSSELVDGYLHMPYEFHLSRSAATSTRNAYESVNDVVATVFAPVIAVFSDTIVVLAISLVLVVRAPVVTLVLLVLLGPIVVVVLRVVQPRVARLGTRHQEAAERVLTDLGQSFHGIREITVSGTQASFREAFNTAKRTQSRSLYLMRTGVEVPRLILETVLYVIVLALLAVTVIRDGSIQNSLTIIGLLAYAAMRTMPALNRMVANLNLMRFGSAAVMPVKADLTLVRQDRRPPSRADHSLGFEDELVARDVGFTYPGAPGPALHDIDLRVRRGGSLGIVGPTGSGKSTLLDILIGLLPPTSGSVTADGVDVHANREAWLRSIGMVHQSVFLFDASLRRNVALGVEDHEVDEVRLLEAIRAAQLDDLLDADRLDEPLGDRGIRLSGGQRQRVGIARALYRRPAVLVFDEGTSALDSRTEQEVLAALEGLRGELTLLVVAHRMSTVRTCDEIVVLDHGCIVGRGTYDELAADSEAFRGLLA